MLFIHQPPSLHAHKISAGPIANFMYNERLTSCGATSQNHRCATRVYLLQQHRLLLRLRKGKSSSQMQPWLERLRAPFEALLRVSHAHPPSYFFASSSASTRLGNTGSTFSAAKKLPQSKFQQIIRSPNIHTGYAYQKWGMILNLQTPNNTRGPTVCKSSHERRVHRHGASHTLPPKINHTIV